MLATGHGPKTLSSTAQLQGTESDPLRHENPSYDHYYSPEELRERNAAMRDAEAIFCRKVHFMNTEGLARYSDKAQSPEASSTSQGEGGC